jgi:hypothetical protein
MILGRGQARFRMAMWAPSAKQRNAATAQKHPAFGGADRSSGFVTALARCAGIALRTPPARKTDPLPSNRINLAGKCSKPQSGPIRCRRRGRVKTAI